MRPDSKRPWVALPHKRQLGKIIFVVVGLRHQGQTGQGVCAFVVVPFHVSNDVRWTTRVQGVFEEVLDLTVDCLDDGTPTPTRDCGTMEVQADVAVRVQIVSLRMRGAEFMTAVLDSFVSLHRYGVQVLGRIHHPEFRTLYPS